MRRLGFWIAMLLGFWLAVALAFWALPAFGQQKWYNRQGQLLANSSSLTVGQVGRVLDGNFAAFKAPADDVLMVGNGTTWEDKTLPTCGASVPLAYDVTTNSFSCGTGGGGGGAPTTAQYLVLALDGTLTAERNLVVDNGLTLNDSGANAAATISWTPQTRVTNATLFDGTAASRSLTFDVTGAGTDPVFTATASTLNLSTGTLQEGSVIVAKQNRTISTTSPLSGGGDLSANRSLTLTTVPLSLGGTNQTSWTHDKCVRVNTAGTALESAAADCGTGGGGMTGIAADTPAGNTTGAIVTLHGTGTGVDTGRSGDTINFAFNPNEVNSASWGDNSQATNTWTFQTSGATDPQLQFTDGLVTIPNAGLTLSLGNLLLNAGRFAQTVTTSAGGLNAAQTEVLSTNTAGGTYLGISAVAKSNATSGTIATLRAVDGEAFKLNAGAVTTAQGGYFKVTNSGATGLIANAYGVYIDATSPGTGGMTNRYALYSAGTLDVSHFGGPVGIGADPPLGAELYVRDSTSPATLTLEATAATMGAVVHLKTVNEEWSIWNDEAGANQFKIASDTATPLSITPEGVTVQTATTTTAASTTGLTANYTTDHASGTGDYRALGAIGTTSSSAALTNVIRGLYAEAKCATTNGCTYDTGIAAQATRTASAGNMSLLAASSFKVSNSNSAGTVTKGVGVNIEPPTDSGNRITNLYGLYQEGSERNSLGGPLEFRTGSFITTLAGAASPAASVTYTLPSNAPAVSGYVLSSTTGGALSWVVQSGGGGGIGTLTTDGGGSATGASVLLQGGLGIITSGTGATVGIDFAANELNSLNWGDSTQATNTWTFQVIGTDPQLEFSDKTVTIPNASLALSAGFLSGAVTSTATSGTVNGTGYVLTGNPASGNATFRGGWFTATTGSGSALINATVGVEGDALCATSNGCTQIVGVSGIAQKSGIQGVTTAMGGEFFVWNNNTTNPIGTGYGVYIADSQPGTGGINNDYALYTAGAEKSSLGGPLEFRGSSSGISTIAADSSGPTITYTLPHLAPAVNGYVLSSTTGGALSWIAPAAGSITGSGLAGSVAIWNASSTLNYGPLTEDATDGRMTNTATRTDTGTVTVSGANLQITGNPGSASTATFVATQSTASTTSGSGLEALVGVYGIATKASNSVVQNGYGLRSIVQNTTATNAIVNGYGLYVDTPVTTGSIGTYYGVYLSPAGGTTKWGFYQAGTEKNSLGGNLELRGGSGTATLAVGSSPTITYTLPSSAPAVNGYVLSSTTGGQWSWIAAAGGGSGDVVGPSSATDNAIARFDTTTGKLIQNSGVTIDDNAQLLSNVTTSSATNFTLLKGQINSQATSGSANYIGMQGVALGSNSSGTNGNLYGAWAQADSAFGTAGAVSNVVGLRVIGQKTGPGNLGTVYGAYVSANNTDAGGSATNLYGLYLDEVNNGTVTTNDFALYSASSSPSLLTGRLGIGAAASGTRMLYVKAPTLDSIVEIATATSAKIAQLKLTTVNETWSIYNDETATNTLKFDSDIGTVFTISAGGNLSLVNGAFQQYMSTTSTTSVNAANFFINPSATSGTGTYTGFVGTAQSNNASGSLGTLVGLQGIVTKGNAGLVGSAEGLYAKVSNTGASGAITNGYGLYIDDSAPGAGGITNDYAIYTAGAEAVSFGGSLDLRAGKYTGIFTTAAVGANNVGVGYTLNDGATSGSGLYIGGDFLVTTNAAAEASGSTLYGGRLTGDCATSDGCTATYGLVAVAKKTGTGAVGSVTGAAVQLANTNATGAVTTATGVSILDASAAGGGLTTLIGLDVAKQTLGGTNIGIRNAGTMVWTPTTQAIAAAGNTITCDTTFKKLTTVTGTTNFTSNPTIADGQTGQLCIIENVDATATDCLGFVDNLGIQVIGGTTLVLCPNDIIAFIYDGTDWIELFASNN